MQLHPHDIITRPNQGGTSLWLSQALVMRVCGVSEEYLWLVRNRYKKSVRACDLAKSTTHLPDTGKAWRWAKLPQGFYYALNNLPDRAPQYYRSQLGSETSLLEAMQKLENSQKKNLYQYAQHQIKNDALQGLNNADIQYYQYDAEVLFSHEKATELAKARAWCQFIQNNYQNKGYTHYGLRTKSDFLEVCTQLLEGENLEGLKVSSSQYLRNKIRNFPSQSYMAQRNYMISDKYANDNARIMGKDVLIDTETGEEFNYDAHQAILYYAYMNPFSSAKEDKVSLYTNHYCPAIEEMGLKPLAYRTCCLYLDTLQTKILADKQRHGKDYYTKTQLTYIPQKKLQYAHSLFAIDGSGTINYKYYNSDGKLKTMKLYVMLVSDVASRNITGWSVAPKGAHSEDYAMLENCLKMSVENCENQTMFEVVTDNHSAFSSAKSQELLGLVFNKVRRIEVGNSQSNPAETEFRLFKKTLKRLYNFGSTSWSVGISGESNPDYFRTEDLPTYEAAIEQFAQLVDDWNNSPLRDGTTPAQRFANKNPKCNDMDARVLRRIFGYKTKVNVARMRGFVVTSKTKGYHHRDDYMFEIPNYHSTGAEMIDKACAYRSDAEVQVVWDEHCADLYTLEGKYIMTCPAVQKASASHAEADDKAEQKRENLHQRKAKQMKASEAFLEDIVDIRQQLPYMHQMQNKGTKESYNKSMQAAEPETKEKTKEEIKRERIEREFNRFKSTNKI